MSAIADLFRRLIAREEVDAVERGSAVMAGQRAGAQERELSDREMRARIPMKGPEYDAAVARRRVR